MLLLLLFFFFVPQPEEEESEECDVDHRRLDYRGKTRKPEKVEYFHPPMRVPRSSFR